MNFNNYLHLEGQHAFLSASKYHWINYSDEKLDTAYLKHKAAQRGTELHALAHECIRLGVKLPKTKNTLNLYVNDAIGFKMTCEQMLFYSENCFGTADTISFRKNTLRIHDLKTGVSPASMRQLEIYTALFCLEYKFKPSTIDVELRLYQNDEVFVNKPLLEDITRIMDTIIRFDKRIEKIKLGG